MGLGEGWFRRHQRHINGASAADPARRGELARRGLAAARAFDRRPLANRMLEVLGGVVGDTTSSKDQR